MDLRKFIFRDNFMATYAKILNDNSGNQILPYTRAKLVYMESNTTAEEVITKITKASKYLYHCNLPVASWASASGNTTYTGFSYSQTVTFTADNGGPTILNDKKIGSPMTTKTNSATTNETLQTNLNIIAAGLIVCTSTTASEVMVFTKEKPSSDITIYFEAQS